MEVQRSSSASSDDLVRQVEDDAEIIDYEAKERELEYKKKKVII